MKRKKIILLSIVFSLVLSSILTYGSDFLGRKYTAKVTAKISLNYPGIDEGLAPNGQPFDIQQMKNEDILNDVIEKVEISKETLTIRKLKENIEIRAYVPDDVMERILPKALEDSNGTAEVQDVMVKSYYPTQYILTLYISNNMKLSRTEGENVLNTLLESYKEAFFKMYKDTDTLSSAIKPIDIDHYDYNDYIEILENQASILDTYLKKKDIEAKDFIAKSSKLSFGDLKTKLDFLMKVEINDIKTLIETYSVTKDGTYLKEIYESKIDKLVREKEKLICQRESITNALSAYEKDPIIVLENGKVLSLNDDKEEKKKDEISFYENLVQRSIDLQTQTNEVTYNIVRYQELISSLNAGEKIADQKHETEVEELVKQVAEKMNTLVKDVVDTTNEYYNEQAFKESIRFVGKTKYKSQFKENLIKNGMLIIVNALLIEAILMIFLLVWGEKIEKYLKKALRLKRTA